MADIRALLRQQREARRIEHPHAAYSDAGKLICVLCREHIRTEALWEEHLRHPTHRKKQAATPLGTNSPSGDSESSTATTSQKRKLDDDSLGDKDVGNDGGDADGRKRTKPSSEEEEDTGVLLPPPPPPTLSRGSSTPSQGVEMQIPSRLTPSAALREEERSASASSASVTPRAGVSMTLPVQPAPAPAPQVDETEWAAFEADIAAAAAPYDEDAVISRPAMTAEESAAAKEKEEQDADISTRKAKADADIEDEREEATRALEEEFDEMQELEARVRRLKEKREALLRKRADSTVGGGMSGVVVSGLEEHKENKENLQTMEVGVALAKDGDADEDEEDDEDDDWDGFRFRTSR